MDGQVRGERVEIDVSKSNVNFEGFGPGKSHEGSFGDWAGNFFVDDETIVGFNGAIQMGSVDTGIEGLDKHLKNEDFFEVERFPLMVFETKSLENGFVVGDLTFLGITKEISFPVEVSGNGLSADFVLDTKPFGMKHVGTNKEVRIFFDLFG